ncbi:glycosyltransferase, partial [Terribacillus saccharophilus]|uniref:glycosyltransferase n=1 Tax=Terribacillus saccharophilus TaxID=361277 RepID=UPI000BA73FC4
PLALFNGIKTPKDFMKESSIEVFEEFLNNQEPDVIHIHTLMGLPKEFLEAAKIKKIRTVYTTHDYYGICPKISLFKENEMSNCEDFKDGLDCVECNLSAYSTQKLLLAQTPFYNLLKKLKRRKTPNTQLNYNEKKINEEQIGLEFNKLRTYYFKMLNSIDYFHFNSSLTKEIFEKYLPDIKGIVIPITHANLKSQKIYKEESNIIRLGYLGPLKTHKGFYELKEAYKALPEGKYALYIYGIDENELESDKGIKVKGKYKSEDLPKIFSGLDVVVIPSIWRETFGFTLLESLAHETPVVSSASVGSSELVKDDYGWVYNNREELQKILMKINFETIESKRKLIQDSFIPDILNDHSNKLINYLYNVSVGEYKID